jgi:Lipocalin-like domain
LSVGWSTLGQVSQRLKRGPCRSNETCVPALADDLQTPTGLPLSCTFVSMIEINRCAFEITVVNDAPLIGTWKLRSFETRTSDGTVFYPWGRETLGYVIFSPEGYFSVAITSANRKRFPTQDMRGGSLEERASAADSYISYSGPCEIGKDKFRVRVEVSLFPNWLGGYQERYYRIEGKTLSVSTTPTLVDGREQVAYLVFERV